MSTHTINLSDVVKTLLEQGFHPRDVRLQLQRRGIVWRYPMARHQGNRERARRRRQFHLCENGDGNRRFWAADHHLELCADCLKAKWAAPDSSPVR